MYFRKGKETKVISKLRENFNEAHYVRTTLLRKNREIGLGRILSCARILKGPSEFLKTRVIIDPRDILLHLVQKKEKSILRNASRENFQRFVKIFRLYSRKKLTNSSIRSRVYRSVVEFDERSCSTKGVLLFSRYLFTRPFFPRNRSDIGDVPTLQRLS